jgi:hypothetical protein
VKRVDHFEYQLGCRCEYAVSGICDLLGGYPLILSPHFITINHQSVEMDRCKNWFKIPDKAQRKK